MAAESVHLTTPDRLSPESVVGTTFTSAFRGFDQDEVRAFLNRIAELLRAAETREAELREQLEAAEERAANLEPVDEDRLAEVLGEETARILVAARQAATDIRAKAEEAAAAMVREAQDEASRLRQEADGVLQERTNEAESAAVAIRQSAEDEATRKLTDAERRLADVVVEADQMRRDAGDDAARIRSEADADVTEIRDEAREAGRVEVEEARRLARELVTEAQVVRERVLTDLAHKRKAARVHLEQLRAGRDRLLSAYDVVRRTLAEATGELEGVLVEAKRSADVAARRVEENEGDSAEVLEAELAAGRLAGLPLVTPAEVEEAAETADTTETSEAPDAVEPETAAEAAVEPALEPIHLPPRRDRRGLFRHRRSSVADELPSADLLPVAPNDPVEEVKVVKDEIVVTADETQELDVHQLFERLKAETEPELAPESPAETATDTEAPLEAEPEVEADEPDPDSEPEAEADADADADAEIESDFESEASSPDDLLLGRRDSIGDEIEQRLARKLKRVLADEQNEVLDRLRRHGSGRIDVDAILAPPDARATSYAEAAAAELSEAAVAGRGFVGANGTASPPVGELAAELAGSITERISDRIAVVVREGEGDDDALADGIRACYREWKSRHLSEAIRHAVVAAFSRGVYDAVASDAGVRWLGDDGGPPCPDCEDNALAGVVGKGDVFPTGHRHPPAHLGCRCLVVPADR